MPPGTYVILSDILYRYLYEVNEILNDIKHLLYRYN